MAEATTLIKFIAAHSAHSRRKAAGIIKNRRVKVNGVVVRKPWREVSEDDDIRINGEKITPGNKVYILLNKPAGFITTMADDEGRPEVTHLIKGAAKERVFPVGRLDKDTTGLLLFTNDGQLAQKLAHPRFSVSKEYGVTLNKPVNPDHLKMMVKGIFLLDGKVSVDRAVFVPKKRKFVVIIELHSGKKRIIRRLFGKFGYEVKKLDRIGYAGLSKRGIPLGKWRKLDQKDIDRLKTVAKLKDEQ